MRELTAVEVDRVSGGAVQLAPGIIGAGLGGLANGGSYAMNAARTGSFSWGGFASHVVHGTVSGFLMGTGSTVIYAAATGAMKGAAPLGASMAGAGAAMQVSAAATGSGPGPLGGGSD